MEVTQVDTTTLQAQHEVNHKHNTEGKHVALTIVQENNESEKKSKKQQLSSKSGAQTNKASKSSKLKTVQDDIELGENSPNIGSADEDSDTEGSGGGGLMQGFGDHWEPDPLVLFMFENAPTLLELSQKGIQAMTSAQLTQCQAQIENSVSSAKETVEKGEEQASQQELKAGGEFAQAGLAAMQTAMQFSDSCVEDDTFSKDYERHESVMSGLKTSSENETSAGGRVDGESSVERLDDTVSAGETDRLTDEEKAGLRKKAQEFKRVQSEKYDEKLNGYKETVRKKNGQTYEVEHKGLNDNLKSKIKKNGWMGLGRSADAVEAENEVIAQRYASRAAYDEVLGRGNNGISFEYDDGDVEVAEGSLSADDVNGLLNGDSLKAQEGRKVFMKELFGETDVEEGLEGDRIPLDMDERMNLIGDWGSKGRSLRKEMLQSYGSTEEGGRMREAFGQERDGALNKARMESDQNRRRMEKRQMLFQNLTGQGANALFDLLQKQHIANAADDEANASLDSSYAQIFGQAQSTENQTVTQLLQDMTGLLDWYNQAHGQLLSAQAAASGV